MKLEKDEHKILSEYTLGFRKKLTLTNKRLIVQQGEGFFRITWKNETEIPLEEIVEACSDGESPTSFNVMKLRLKNGDTREIHFMPKDSEIMKQPTDSTAVQTRVKSITDRWVNEVNSLITGRRNEEAIKSAVECYRTVRESMGSVHKRDR